MSLLSPALAGGFFTTSTTWEAHGQRNLEGHSPCGCRELDVAERLSTLIMLTMLLASPAWQSGSAMCTHLSPLCISFPLSYHRAFSPPGFKINWPIILNFLPHWGIPIHRLAFQRDLSGCPLTTHQPSIYRYHTCRFNQVQSKNVRKMEIR